MLIFVINLKIIMGLELIIILVINMAVYRSAFNVRPLLLPAGKELPKNDNPNNRILNGFTPGQFDVPWVVLLRIQYPQGVASCTGSIISPEWVLTAGHCAKGALAVQVQLGLYNKNSAPAQTINISSSRIIVHPNYIGNKTIIINDIALLQLNPRANTTLKSIKSIAYSCPTSGNFVGRIGRACGWGITNDNAKNIPTMVQCVDMPVIADQECLQTWRNVFRPTNICTRTVNFRSTCDGDSGGPLIVVDEPLQKLIGATSFGSVQCASRAPNVFTRITSYNDWIARTTGVLCM